MISLFNRRQFCNLFASVPLIGWSFQRSNSNRLAQQGLINDLHHKRMMVICYDLESAMKIIPHMGLKQVQLNVPRGEYIPSPWSEVPTVTFFEARLGTSGPFNAHSAGAWREGHNCSLVLLQDSSKYGTFKVVKSRNTRHGEVLNVFTHKRTPALSNV